MIEGGISPSILEKNYIESEKKMLSKSKLRNWLRKSSPPKFNPHPNHYNETKKMVAKYEQESKLKKIMDE
jgi:hypothetical protein